MIKSTAEFNQEITHQLSNSMGRMLREFSRDYDRRMLQIMWERGYTDLRPAHNIVFSNLGLGAVRVTELAERAQVTQQAMGKTLKELERLGYVSRGIDPEDRRAKEIRLTQRGMEMAIDGLEALAEVREYYKNTIGSESLAIFETSLRTAVEKLHLQYLPDTWWEADPE